MITALLTIDLDCEIRVIGSAKIKSAKIIKFDEIAKIGTLENIWLYSNHNDFGSKISRN